jgi:hypothetical protein
VLQALPATGRSAEAGPVRPHCDATVRHNLVCSVASHRMPSNATLHTKRSQRPGRHGGACRLGSSRCQRGWRECRGRSAGFCIPTTEKEPGRAPVLVDSVAIPACSSHFPPWSSGSVAPAGAPNHPRADRAITFDAACSSGVQRGHVSQPPTQGGFFAKSALPQYRGQILELNPTDIA